MPCSSSFRIETFGKILESVLDRRIPRYSPAYVSGCRDVSGWICVVWGDLNWPFIFVQAGDDEGKGKISVLSRIRHQLPVHSPLNSPMVVARSSTLRALVSAM